MADKSETQRDSQGVQSEYLKGLNPIQYPRALLILGLICYLVGFVLSALGKFETGYVRSDALWLGSIALFTSASLWISFRFGHPRIGRMVVRGFFVAIVLGWIYAGFQLMTSQLHVGVAVFLSLALGVLVYGAWFLTWRLTLMRR